MNESEFTEMLEWANSSGISLEIAVILLEHNITKSDLVRIPLHILESIGITESNILSTLVSSIQAL
jgi:hypothetical protein